MNDGILFDSLIVGFVAQKYNEYFLSRACSHITDPHTFLSSLAYVKKVIKFQNTFSVL